MDDITSLSLEELTELNTTKQARFNELLALETPSKAEVAEAKALAPEIDAIEAAITAAEQADESDMDDFAALKERKAAADKAQAEAEGGDGDAENGEGDGDGDGAESTDGDEAGAEDSESTEPVEAEAPAAGQVAAKSKTTAAAKRPASGGSVQKLAKRSTRPAPPEADAEQERKHPSGAGAPALIASAGLADFGAGDRLTMTQVGEAVLSRAGSFQAPSGQYDFDDENYVADWRRHGTLKLALDIPEELMIDREEDTERTEQAIERATDESRLPGGSLVASGGWCAPSETMYDLDTDMTREGILSLPEVGVRRGGMRFVNQPNFADFYANPGFIQTETQAIAGTTKPCVEVPCPTFQDVRLDVEGLCIRVPILTQRGYPEQVANFTANTLIAHDHWINANVIGRLVTASGSLRTFTADSLGSSVDDAISALLLVINQRREVHRLSMNAAMEVVLPFWVKDMFKTDIARRNGRDAASVSDAEIQAIFTGVKANVQFVYDWTTIGTGNVWPANFKALVYPAGTFVKGVAPVISLDTVYDAASLAVNTYTGLFTEQGLLVAKKKLGSDYVQIPTCNAGRSGAANFTCS